MSAPKSKGLGKGLSALMGDAASPASSPAPSGAAGNSNGAPLMLPLSALKPGKYQPRTNFRLEQLQELAESIARNGIMQPIVVRETAEDGVYEIVAGERRWRAAKLADLTQVPVIVRELSDQVALELALVENIQRQDLSPVEEALGYQRLMDEFHYTQEELADTVGKSRSHVANLLRLTQLPEEIKEMLDKGDLSMGHARALLNTPNQVEVAQEVVRRGLNVRQTEALARRDPSKPSAGRPRKYSPRGGAGDVANDFGPKDADILALEETLSESLGLRVSINDSGNRGRITIEYDNLEQLDDILRRLGGGV